MDDVLAVMDAAGSERAALFGASEGGPMSMLCAATHPHRVSALAVFGTFPRMLEADDYEHGLPEEVLDSFFDVLEEDWGGPAAIGMFAPSLVDDKRFRDSWARYLRLGTSPRGAQSLLRMYKEIDVRDVLGTISVPTLVVHRKGDLVVQVATGRYIAEQIPGAKFVELAGDDHLPWAGDWHALVGEIEEFLTGERGVADIDRVLATVMFTDIVGSTESAARLGDRGWGDVVARHDELVRRKLDRYRGRPVKTLGDGFLATFDGPARAVRCAREIAEEVRALGIEVRAGLHTGECELVGDDVAGMAINIGARVSSLAGPGEVLVSRTVKDLVYGSGIEFSDRGEHALKGVPGDWRLYAVEGV
jgi:class 3 adenylate cyclase